MILMAFSGNFCQRLSMNVLFGIHLRQTAEPKDNLAVCNEEKSLSPLLSECLSIRQRETQARVSDSLEDVL